jgi:DNA-binding transcriptional MocR family regulator
MQAISKQSSEFLYQQVIELIQQMQRSGTLRAGDKLPSLRKLSSRLEVSVPTVKQAYLELERQGAIAARPQSGYYLKAENAKPLRSTRAQWRKTEPTPVKCRSLIERVYEEVHKPNVVPLGIANPVMACSPDKTLARTMRRVLSKVAAKAVSYGPIHGDPDLRRQIAYRYQDHGTKADPEQLVITNGAQEAMSIALQCVAKAGDVIAVESPTFFGLLELIEALDMKAMEIRTCSDTGLCLDDLAQAIELHPIKACIFASSINNPMGSLMPEEQREKMVRLLEEKDIPLIEDDVYGELYFGEKQPRPAAYYSRKNLVMTCSSFSKTAAPGYRLGWLMPGKWEEQAKRLKRSHSCSTGMLQQWTMSEFIKSGDYDRHLKVLRKTLAFNSERMRCHVAKHFPEDTCICTPQGGSVLWIKCPKNINTATLFETAIEQGISFTPGSIFSPSGKYHDYMRISFGVVWDEVIEDAVVKLGALVRNA